jgi:uncharacterized membrane-anchored protein YhcB (DUF1043 family)
MKNSILWAIIAILLGIALFGFLKSLELATRNVVLTNSLGVLKTKLDKTQVSLDSAKQALSESYLKSAELEGRLAVMDKKLNQQARDIKGYLGKISDMSVKLQYTARANASLYAENKGITNQLLRTRLESQEMRTKLSSITELKKAIKELKVKIRQEKKSRKIQPAIQKKAVQEKKVLMLPAQEEIMEQPFEGNAGFLIKDGKSTFEGLVDIRVVPAEPVIAL